MNKKILKIFSFIFIIFFIISGNITLSKEISNGKKGSLDQQVVNDSVVYETDPDTDSGQVSKKSNMLIEGYVGYIEDPNVDYISVSVPTTGFFQLVTNAPVSVYGNKAVWVTPEYKIMNNGPNPIRVVLENVEPHHDTQAKDIELDPNASINDQAGNLSGLPKAKLSILLCTLGNWLNSDRTQKNIESPPNGIPIRTINGPFWDNIIPPGIIVGLDEYKGYRLGYVDGTSAQPDESKRKAVYKLQMNHDTLNSNEYNENISPTDFKFTFSIHSVILSKE